MADQAMAAEGAGEVEVEVQPKKGGISPKKLVLFIVLPLLVLGGGGAGAYFAGLLDPYLGHNAGAAASAEETHADSDSFVFYDLPELLVNLNTGGRRSSFLKISISLELRNQDTTARLKAVMPRIIDNFQVYLRELRIEDLSGSAGLERLREELLLRVNAAVHPDVVNDVLFKEMLIQ